MASPIDDVIFIPVPRQATRLAFRFRRSHVIDWEVQLLRSLLFVPGDDERKLAKAATIGADAIVIDLEDAVADTQKATARATTGASIPNFGNAFAVFVRVNAATTGMLEDDVAAVVTRDLDAIMVPKVEDANTLARADEAVTAAERAAAVEPGTIRLFPVIETPLGLTRCESILASAPARVHTSVFGSADFTAALGVDLTHDASEIHYARSRVIVASRAMGLAAPIDGPWLWLDDVEGLGADSMRSRRLGFQGRVVLHPSQVVPVQDSYSALGEADVARARRVVAAFEESEARGIASLRVDGQFVDYPIYRLARERIRRHEPSPTERRTRARGLPASET